MMIETDKEIEMKYFAYHFDTVDQANFAVEAFGFAGYEASRKGATVFYAAATPETIATGIILKASEFQA